MEFSADNFVEKFWSCRFLLKNFMGLKDKIAITKTGFGEKWIAITKTDHKTEDLIINLFFGQ